MFVSALADILRGFESAARELIAAFQPPHIFKVGEYATRDGSDVQRVISVTDIFADFQCILAPLTGWCEVGEVEHNAMRRYRLLTKEQAEAMIQEIQCA